MVTTTDVRSVRTINNTVWGPDMIDAAEKLLSKHATITFQARSLKRVTVFETNTTSR